MEEPSYETPKQREERTKRELKEQRKAATLQAKAEKKDLEKKAYEDELEAKFAKLKGMIKKGSELG